MAYYAALVQLVQLLDDIRHDHVRYRNFFLAKREITKSLHEKFSLLQKSLENYSSNGDEAADYLEKRIRDASYQAQDIIESQIPDEETHVIMKILCRLISAMCPKRRREVYRVLKRAEEEVDSILDELQRIKESCKIEVFGGSKSSLDYVDVGGSERAPSAGNTMVGFDEHLTTIKDQLCGGSPELQTVPIVGMGGIGKTTLAQNILDDKLIVHHFDIRVWVTISQNYHTQNVFRAILESINSATQEFRELREEQLAVYIHQRLKGWRYLIIMDDIWSTNVLDDVKRVSPDDYNGSRILLTTRLSKVAVYDNTVGSCHQMQFLNEEQSWNLLREKVFGQACCPLKFEDLGKSIAHNCRGLPLAIVAVAGVLSKVNRTRYNWKKIASNVGSVVTENDKHFSKILYLSYNYLPHHLKPCFLYIGIFLEDREISVSTLIKLWIAEGFLKSSKEFKCLEEVGEEYLDDLVKRNLVLITKKRYNGKSKFCNIHDLLRDLCTQRIRWENFFHVTSEYECISEGNKYIRRVCFNSKRGYGFHHRDKTVSSLNVRSILCLHDYFPLPETLSCAKRLMVLDALQYNIGDFPESILDLFHLRYLALHIGSFYVQNTRIPPLISKLRNLETLILIPNIRSLTFH